MVGRTTDGVAAGMTATEVEAALGPPELIYRGPDPQTNDRDRFVTRLYPSRRLLVESIGDAVVQVQTYAEPVEREPWFRTFLEAVAKLDGEPG